MQIRRINADSAPVPTTGYSQALEVSGHTRTLFVSGQIPVAADGRRAAGFRGAMQARVEHRRSAIEGGRHDARTISYLADRRYTTINRAVRNEVLGGRETALTVVIASIFDEAWLLEIEVVAMAWADPTDSAGPYRKSGDRRWFKKEQKLSSL